ncbi:hypothetical protein JZU68_06985, partial [bacterium]|nr:hypothetical protein [bacterium]
TDFSIEGLPNAETAFFDFPNLKIKSVNQDIQMMVGSSIPKNIQLPEEINLLVVFKGRLKEFETSVGLNSSFGNAMLFGRVDKKENFSGSLNIFSFDVGN